MSKEEKFIPGSEPLAVFEQVLNLLKEWIQAGIVIVEVEEDGDVDFTLPDDMESLLKMQLPQDLDFKKVRSIIKTEIRFLGCSIFRHNAIKWLEKVLPDDLKIESLPERIEIVEKLLSDDIKKRVWLRKSTKNFVINEISSNKCTLHKNEYDIPYLSVEFSFMKPSSGMVLTFTSEEGALRPAGAENKQISLDLTKEDLKGLIDELNLLYKNHF